MSNRAAPHRKFVQTFVLAEQPTGYYVLNDIFRYLLEEEEEEEVEGEVEMTNGVSNEQIAPVAPAPVDTEESVPATLTSSNDPVQQKHDAEHIDRKLEEEVLGKPEDQKVNGVLPSETPVATHIEDAPAAIAEETTPPAPALEQAAESVAAEEQSEKPRDPDPTPIASPPKPASTAPVEAPAAPPKPAAPKTWANLVASKGAATATASPTVKAAPPATPAPLKPKTTNSSSKESMTPPTTSGEEVQAKPQQNGNSGWQMAGADNKQRQGRQHSQSISSNQENVLGYVKNVTDKVDASLLRTTLTSFGKLAYFDVSRQKVRSNLFHIPI